MVRASCENIAVNPEGIDLCLEVGGDGAAEGQNGSGCDFPISS